MKSLLKNGITYKGGKRYLSLIEKFDLTQVYSAEEAVKTVKGLSTAKFDESIDLTYKLNIKQKHTIRDVLVMPNSVGKQVRVLAFAAGDKAAEATAAGADYVGAEDLVEKILKGWLEFDAVLATPDMMKVIGKIAPILGRRKMMPNPKTGTVTLDVARVVKEFKAGKVEIRADKTGNVSVLVGKKSLGDQALLENILAVQKVLMKNKPADLKGDYIKTMVLSPTMGPSVKVDFKKIG